MNIDDIVINFSPEALVFLNISLAFLMFGVALDIKIDDFKRVIANPRIPLIGLTSEYLLLPLLTIALIFVFKPQASLALGMILIACCPGGSTSNYMVHLSKGNSALSVMLTSITTLGAIFITPIAFTLWAKLAPIDPSAVKAISVDPISMIKTIVVLILIPVSIGMFLNHNLPEFTKKIEGIVRKISMLIFFGVVVGAISKNWDNIFAYVHIVFLLVLVHNGLALLMGYGFAKALSVEERDARAIAIETGIQNSGLGLILVFNVFNGIGGMALILAWWGIWHLVTGFGLASFWRRRAT